MEALFLLAQTAEQSKESWLIGAVILMVIFNIIWKPIERKLFPNDTLDKLVIAVATVQKHTESLYTMHDDKDPLSGQYRWKMGHAMTQAIQKQTELLQEMKDNQIKELAALTSLKEAIQSMNVTLTRRYIPSKNSGIMRDGK